MKIYLINYNFHQNINLITKNVHVTKIIHATIDY
jgi:hypothetical protein